MSRAMLRRELVRLRNQWHDVDGLAYRGPADFVLKEGTQFKPVGVRWGVPKHCFGNALILATLRDFTYVEGFAVPPASTRRVRYIGGPVERHAWVLDTDGKPWEVTWPDVGRAYMGVAFSPGRADDATWNGDACVIDDFRRGWPLLQHAWTGEDWDRVWPPSELETLLRADAHRIHPAFGQILT